MVANVTVPGAAAGRQPQPAAISDRSAACSGAVSSQLPRFPFIGGTQRWIQAGPAIAPVRRCRWSTHATAAVRQWLNRQALPTRRRWGNQRMQQLKWQARGAGRLRSLEAQQQLLRGTSECGDRSSA